MGLKELIKKFLGFFEKASNNILNRIREMVKPSEEEEVLSTVTEIINQLVEKSSKLLPKIIKKAYKNGSNEAIKSMIKQGFSESDISRTLKTVIHQEAVQAIVDEAFYSVLEATDNMSVDTKERIREIVKLANERSLKDGVIRRQAIKDAATLLTEEHITGIVDAAGRRWPIDKYMANVIQYHQRKAHVEGSLNRMIENGHDLVYVNSVGITCELCAQYQGRVYSISGKDKRFPKLIRPPFHSHCIHGVSDWNEEYYDEEEIERYIKESNRPFKDNRTEANIRKHNQLQREKSKQNETRKQWIRYKSRIPDLPDLRTFASQKARNTKKYQEWRELYRKVNSEIKKRGN